MVLDLNDSFSFIVNNSCYKQQIYEKQFKVGYLCLSFHFLNIIFLKKCFLVFVLFFSLSLNAQNTFNFDGQLSGVVNWSPDNEVWGLLNGRYLPELNYNWELDSIHNWYFEASANIWGSSYFYKNDSTSTSGDIEAYRIYTRFSGKQYEVRLGLQKIDFGLGLYYFRI